MKLTDELRENIEEYFKNISAEELYDILTQKYQMPVWDTINTGIIDYVSKESVLSDTFSCAVIYKDSVREQEEFDCLSTNPVESGTDDGMNTDIEDNNLPFAA